MRSAPVPDIGFVGLIEESDGAVTVRDLYGYAVLWGIVNIVELVSIEEWMIWIAKEVFAVTVDGCLLDSCGKATETCLEVFGAQASGPLFSQLLAPTPDLFKLAPLVSGPGFAFQLAELL